jgi:hypothetical protein
MEMVGNREEIQDGGVRAPSPSPSTAHLRSRLFISFSLSHSNRITLYPLEAVLRLHVPCPTSPSTTRSSLPSYS